MAFERWGKEKKEKEPTLGEVLRDGWKALRVAASVANYIDENRGVMEQRGRDALRQLEQHPDSFKQIAINLGADLVDGFQERERKRVQERTGIHQKTVAAMARFHQRQKERGEADAQEQEAARQSQEAAREIDTAIVAGIEELAARLNKWSSRKPKP